MGHQLSKAKFPLIALAVILTSTGCTTTSNTVGAAYDADSYYCRELARDKEIVIREGLGSDQEELTSEQLYERYCEPVASLVERAPQRYSDTKDLEKSAPSIFMDLLKRITK